jgi:hypothetical protein
MLLMDNKFSRIKEISCYLTTRSNASGTALQAAGGAV